MIARLGFGRPDIDFPEEAQVRVPDWRRVSNAPANAGLFMKFGVGFGTSITLQVKFWILNSLFKNMKELSTYLTRS